jgi:hypothetical protein
MTQSVIIAGVRYIDLTAFKACFIPDVSAHADCIGSIAHAHPSTFGYRFAATVLQRSEVASTLANWALPEGIVSKRLGSRYRSGRSPDWLKFKNPLAPAVKREAEEDWE